MVLGVTDASLVEVGSLHTYLPSPTPPTVTTLTLSTPEGPDVCEPSPKPSCLELGGLNWSQGY